MPEVLFWGPQPPRTRSENFSEVLRTRESEAGEFYQELTPRTASDDEAMVMRQASSAAVCRSPMRPANHPARMISVS